MKSESKYIVIRAYPDGTFKECRSIKQASNEEDGNYLQ